MITDTLFNWFGSAVRWVLGLLPEWSLPDLSGDVEAFFTRIWPHAKLIAWLNLYVPLGEAILLLTAGLLFWLAAHIFNAASYVLTKLHITGGAQ